MAAEAEAVRRALGVYARLPTQAPSTACLVFSAAACGADCSAARAKPNFYCAVFSHDFGLHFEKIQLLRVLSLNTIK
jgi:hypothetical protein